MIALTLLASSFLTQGSPSPAPSGTPRAFVFFSSHPFPHPPTGWTATLSLSTSAGVRFGDSVSVKVALKNIDSKAEYVLAPDTPCSYHLTLLDQTGSGGDDSFGRGCPANDERVQIAPGQTRTFALSLTSLIDSGNPGSHTVGLLALNVCADETGPCQLASISANHPALTVLPYESYGPENSGWKIAATVTPSTGDASVPRTVHVRVMNVSDAPQLASGDVCNFELLVIDAATGLTTAHYQCEVITHISSSRPVPPGGPLDVHFALTRAPTMPGRYYVIVAALYATQVTPVASNAATVTVTR